MGGARDAATLELRLKAKRRSDVMGSEIGCCGGSLLGGRGRFQRMLAITAGCVLIGVLWAAGPANAASHRWTIRNASNVKLTLVSVTPYEHHHMGFEGRPADGSGLQPRHAARSNEAAL